MSEQLTYKPNKDQIVDLQLVDDVFDKCLKECRKKRRILNGKTPKEYRDENEKRFLSYPPQRDVNDDDWQFNLVMGTTRNAEMNLISRIGSQVPRLDFTAVLKSGAVSSEASEMAGNLYRWANKREAANHLQQFASLGGFMRGNWCWFEDWEDETKEVDIITKFDFITGDYSSHKSKVRRWGPKRTAVPVDEIFYRDFWKSSLKLQKEVIWRQFLTKDQFEAKWGKNQFAKFVKTGNPQATDVESYFKPSYDLGNDLIEIRRFYGNPWMGGKDKFIVVANGVLLISTPLPYNHKYPPFIWGITEPMMDDFMIGMATPWKLMNQQDAGDTLFNSILDRAVLAVNRPMKTTEKDPSSRIVFAPNEVIRLGEDVAGNAATLDVLNFDGVSQGDLAVYQEVLRLGKEDSGAYGGASMMTPRGGKVAARQAMMAEEQAKMLLQIPMGNFEEGERELAVQRTANTWQWAGSSGERIEMDDALLSTGDKGRLVVSFAKSNQEAQKLVPEMNQTEAEGDAENNPTEHVATTPDWFSAVDRIEAMVEVDSSYQTSKSIASAATVEAVRGAASIPDIQQRTDWDAATEDYWKAQGKNPSRFTKKAPPPQPAQPVGPGSEVNMPGQMSGSPDAKALSVAVGQTA